MRKRAVMAIFRKELRTLLKDKKTIFTMIGLPLILYPVMIILVSTIIINMSAKQESAVGKLAVCGNDPYVTEFLSEGTEEIPAFEIAEGVPDAAEAEKMLADGQVDAVLISGDGGYTVVSLSSKSSSRTAAEHLMTRLKEYRELETERIISDNGMNAKAVMEPFSIEEKDIATGEQTMGSIIGGVIPLLIIIGVFLGTMQPAMDTTAGERERSTQETLMTFPVTGRELITGKFLLVSFCGLVSALLYLVTVTILGLYVMGLFGSMEETAISVNLASFLPSVGVVLLAVMAFSLFLGAAFMCICSFAKSTKEASGYIAPLMFVVMMVSYAGMLDISLSGGLAIVPVLNTVLLIKAVFLFNYDLPVILTVLISNMAYAAIAIALLGKLYTSERVLFGEGGSSLLERPSEWKKGALPTLGDGVITLLVSLTLYLYLGSLLQLRLGFAGVGLTQLLILAVPVLMAVFGRLDLGATFSVKKPRISQILASVLIGIGGFIVFNLLTSLVFPEDSESVQVYSDMFSELVSGKSLWIELLVIGLAPAICEEALFRGYLASSLHKMKPFWIALITSVIFGLYHMNLVQGVYAFLLGLVLCMVVKKTGSIFCGSVIHLTANALAVLLSALLTKTADGSLTGPLKALGEFLTTVPALPFMAAGLVFLLAGGLWLKGTVLPRRIGDGS